MNFLSLLSVITLLSTQTLAEAISHCKEYYPNPKTPSKAKKFFKKANEKNHNFPNFQERIFDENLNEIQARLPREGSSFTTTPAKFSENFGKAKKTPVGCKLCANGYYAAPMKSGLNYYTCHQCSSRCKLCKYDSASKASWTKIPPSICTTCNDRFFVKNGKCWRCMEGCKKCTGGNSDDILLQ